MKYEITEGQYEKIGVGMSIRVQYGKLQDSRSI